MTETKSHRRLKQAREFERQAKAYLEEAERREAKYNEQIAKEVEKARALRESANAHIWFSKVMGVLCVGMLLIFVAHLIGAN